MNKKQVVLLFFIALMLGSILFFTFAYFKKEKERLLENASNNKMIEEVDKKEKEEQQLKEEQQKRENGQKELKSLLDGLQNTTKIILSKEDENGKIVSLNKLHKYTQKNIITDENIIKDILSCFANSTWQENKNLDYDRKLWQFYDSQENLLLEYTSHSLLMKEKELFISFQEEDENKLNRYFEQNVVE